MFLTVARGQVSLAGLLGTQPASSSLERTAGLHRTRNVSDDSAGIEASEGGVTCGSKSVSPDIEEVGR